MLLLALFGCMVVGYMQVNASLHPLHRHHHHDKGNGSAIAWDHFMLVTEWPQSTCEFIRSSHQHHKCVIPPQVTGWTLHGIWPSVDTGPQPFYCTHQKFDPAKIQDLVEELEVDWPNLFTETSQNSFWKHEYEKHGTCASTVEGFHTEHDFFETTIQLKRKYDVTSALSKELIVPSFEKSYTLGEITDALRDNFNVDVCIECAPVKGVGQVLAGAYICLDKNTRLVDCNYCEHACENQPIKYHPLQHLV